MANDDSQSRALDAPARRAGAGPSRRRGIMYARLMAFTAGFSVILILLIESYHYFAPTFAAALDAKRSASPHAYKPVGLMTFVLLILVLFLLAALLLLTFRAARFFIPTPPPPPKPAPAEDIDPWEEAGRRLNSAPPASNENLDKDDTD
jgi:hypothetical protein